VNAPRIVVVGSLNSDLVAYLERFPDAGETVRGRSFSTFCGGKGANQAYAAGKLGASAAMVGQVGDDPSGAAQLHNLESAGVDTTFVSRDYGASTGTAIIEVDAARQNRIIVIPGANGTFTPARLEACRQMLANTEIVLLQLEIPMETVEAAAAIAKSGGARVILDPAPAAALSDSLLKNVDYLTPNQSELMGLVGSDTSDPAEDEVIRAARELCGRGARKVIAKLGDRGALLITPTTVEHWRAFDVTPVDTTAAGDCFNAAFAAALVAGKAESEAGRFACAAAAVSVTRAGAQASMPTREEAQHMLAHQPHKAAAAAIR
jgi:ribokinase